MHLFLTVHLCTIKESSMVVNTQNNKSEKYVFLFELRLFLLMLNVEPILLISMLLFNTVGQLFHKVLPKDVPYLHKDDVTEILA